MPKIDKKADRASLLAFAEAVDTRPQLLQLDEYADWRLAGRKGHVYAIPEYGAFYVYVTAGSAMAWTHAKKSLDFEVSQDGDEEGVFRLTRLPVKTEAKTIRRLVGLPQRRHLTEARRAKLAETGFKRQSLAV